jgi:hypothetical protein
MNALPSLNDCILSLEERSLEKSYNSLTAEDQEKPFSALSMYLTARQWLLWSKWQGPKSSLQKVCIFFSIFS